MIARARIRRISDIALPIVAGVTAANLMTFVDTLMVGQLGEAALGGVGIGGQLFLLLLTAVLGLGAGVQAMVARRVGEGRLQATGLVLNAGALLAVAVGLLLVAIGYVTLPVMFGLLNNDPILVKEGVSYLSTRMPSVLIIGVNVVFRSYWVGVSLAKWSMVSIFALSAANVLFNYMFIFGNFGAPRLEVAGAGLGSTLAVAVGLLVNVSLAWRLALRTGFLRGLPSREDCKRIVTLSYPDSARQTLFSIGVVGMYVLVGYSGTRELAAFHVIVSICLVAYTPHLGLGGAATTLVGEALGRADVKDATRWGWDVANVSLVLLAGIGLLVITFAGELLGLFLVDSMTLSLAVLPLQLGVLGHVLDGYAKVVGAALIGAGATGAAMKLTVLPQWLILLPLLVGVVALGGDLAQAMMVFVAYTLVSALLFVFFWYRGGWQGIRI